MCVKEENSLLLWPNGVDTIGEFFRLVEIGQLALHPDEIGIRRVRNRSRDGRLAPASDAIEAFACPGSVPVEMHIHARQALRYRARFGIALPLGLPLELGDHAGFVDVHAGVDGVGDGFVEELEVSLRVPGVFDGLQGGAGFAGGFGVEHEVVEGLEGGVGSAEDVGVVAGVDGAGY